MSLKQRRLETLGARIRGLYQEEQRAETPFVRNRSYLHRWFLMLLREFRKDDVKIRSESLAYLMLVSLLPLLAGLFFLFTIFTQFGMVQEALSGLSHKILSTFPIEHQNMIEEYVLKFKDAYLSNMQGKSSSLGIFALTFLFWVGLQTFNNIERTLNYIWSSESERPFLEKARNFLVVAIVAPIVLIASLSVPLILKQNQFTRELLQAIPFLPTLLNFIIPVLLIYATLVALYRYTPVRTVPWRSATIGALFAAVLLQASNLAMNLYFKLGTHTAYGKIAIIPLLAFWIYIVWMIVILGAELSYLVENEKYIIREQTRPPSMQDGESLLQVLALIKSSYQNGGKLWTFDEIHRELEINRDALKEILEYLEYNSLLAICQNPDDKGLESYVLRKDLSSENLSKLLKNFFGPAKTTKKTDPVSALYAEATNKWLKSFEGKTL